MRAIPYVWLCIGIFCLSLALLAGDKLWWVLLVCLFWSSWITGCIYMAIRQERRRAGPIKAPEEGKP